MATKTLSKDQILEAIDGMTVLELSELVKQQGYRNRAGGSDDAGRSPSRGYHHPQDEC
jgi:hypothetical protein